MDKSKAIGGAAGKKAAPDLPRYHQLANILAQRIEGGVHKVGDLLPTEIELCEEFDVSRYTVREALRRLIEAGLVRRRQGSGSQVIAAQAPQNFVHSMRSLSELYQYAADTMFKVGRVEILVPDAKVAPYLDGKPDKPWLYVEAVRRQGDDRASICFSRVFIDKSYEGIAKYLKGFSGTIYKLIECQYGVEVVDVEQRISSEPMSKYAARQLGVSPRLWAVKVVRRYFDTDGKILQVSVNYHPADRFFYTMHLRREGHKGWS